MEKEIVIIKEENNEEALNLLLENNENIVELEQEGASGTSDYQILLKEENNEETLNLLSEGISENLINLKQEGAGGTSDYQALLNKPSINGVELSNNKTLDELGIQPKGNYLTEIPEEYVTETELNNKGYATKEELKDIDVDLTDYYTKTEIDNKNYVTQEDLGDIDIDINSISDETIEEIVNINIVNANEVYY